MARILDANCQAKVVKVEGKTVNATILSQGTKASTGVALLQSDKLTYVTSNATDIKDLITALGDLIDKIVLALSGIDAVTTVPGSNAASIALITTLKTVMVLQKDNLK